MHFTGRLLTCFLLAASFFTTAAAQSGCTDPDAKNYDPNAKSNDGSCLYEVTHGTPLHRATFPAVLSESSGLVLTDGRLWSHDDSGNPNCIFSVDTSTGKILQTVYIDNFANTDWEDITADSNYIYIENAGNNNGTRKDLQIIKIKKSDIGADTAAHVNGEAIDFSYADQASFDKSSTNNYDCESVIAIGSYLYLFSKDRGDGHTRVYKVSKTPGTYSLQPYGELNAGGLVTGADYDPVTHEVVLIGYLKGHASSFLWILNDFRDDHFFSGNKRRIEIGNGSEWQTEGVCYKSPGNLLISCETAGSAQASLYSLNKSSWKFHTSGIGTNALPQVKIYPNPCSDILYIDALKGIDNLKITDMLGRDIYTAQHCTAQYQVQLSGINIPKGMYCLKIESAGTVYIFSVVFQR